MSSLINKSDRQAKYLDHLATNKKEYADTLLIPYANLLKSIGGRHAFQLFESELNTSQQFFRDDLIDILFEWPDEWALDTLAKLAQDSREMRSQIKSIRAMLRILRVNDLPNDRKLGYYDQIMRVARRPEEKQMIISDVMRIKTEDALDFLIMNLKDQKVRETIVRGLFAYLNQESEEIFARKLSEKLLIRNFPGDSVQKYIYDQIDSDLNVPPEGYTAIFNGKDLSGWKGLVADPPKRRMMTQSTLDSLQKIADDEMRSHWFVDAGILRFDGKGANLCTIKEYKNFELLIDWKIEKNGDSGIYLRGMPQVQIKDQYLEMGGSGGLYNNKIGENRPLEIADREPGQWNRFRIIMTGNKVTVYLNNRLVVDGVRMENYWERKRDAYEKGSIELQAHNSPLYFRNIFIKELPDTGLHDGELFNGQDLKGWTVIHSKENRWRVVDGILNIDSAGQGWLSTEQQYSDFELSLDFRVSPGGNSGIFLRAPHEGDPAYTGIEVQILDDYAEKYSNLKSWQYTASLYGVEAAVPGVSKPANQWQSMKIICNGPKIQVILNEKTVIDTNIVDHMWQTSRHPGLKRRTGFIGLQAHGSKVEYKNIQLKELQ
jgi:hypothetical protein